MAPYKLYPYDPSLAAAVMFAILFSAVTFYHIFQMGRSRAWFLIPLVVGGFFEVTGFVCRAFNATQTPNWSMAPFIIQTILTLVAPALFAGSIYMILGRIILMTDGESYSMIRRTWLTKLFVAGDVVAFLMQASGGGMMAGRTASAIKLGQNVIVGGLLAQILFFGLFVFVAFLFHRRMARGPTSISLTVPWAKHLHALYISSGLILIRSVFRVVEFLQGRDGFIMEHEVFIYVFDAVLMWGVLVLFCWIYPGEIREFLEREKRGSRGSEVPLEEGVRHERKRHHHHHHHHQHERK